MYDHKLMAIVRKSIEKTHKHADGSASDETTGRNSNEDTVSDQAEAVKVVDQNIKSNLVPPRSKSVSVLKQTHTLPPLGLAEKS